MFSIVRHWCIDWLDRRGLQSIAAVLETRAALGGDVDAMHAAAKRALLRGRHVDALNVIEPALQKQPGNAALWCTRGIAHRLALSYDQALADYEHAYQLDPKDVRTLGNLGEWYLARNAFAKALTWLDRALALDPSYY
ncbi:MAG: tetratricopeptide repeat protein [Burkholderiales bacterium]|nr:tetratricopeptide repeat protein [Burkholderiales bacterium]